MQDNVLTLYYDERSRDDFIHNGLSHSIFEAHLWDSPNQKLTILDNGVITCYHLYCVRNHQRFIRSIQGHSYTRTYQLEPIPVESENYAKSRVRGGLQEVC